MYSGCQITWCTTGYSEGQETGTVYPINLQDGSLYAESGSAGGSVMVEIHKM